MIELHYWPTGNGQKIAICLEEMGLAWEPHPVNIGKGEQFKPAFLAISPNNRIPAILDRDPPGGGEPVPVFESGAILVYLAEKTGQFMPQDLRGRKAVLEWLFWQVGGLGPMAGQKNHFKQHAPEPIPYALDRYTKETNRLYGVLDRRLADNEYLVGAYSVADMASYPWALSGRNAKDDMAEFKNIARWMAAIEARPAVKRAYAKAEPIRAAGQVSEEERRKILYGQTAQSVADMSRKG
jgi:GST-like protein